MAHENTRETVWMLLGARGPGGKQLDPRTRVELPSTVARALYRAKKAVPYTDQDGVELEEIEAPAEAPEADAADAVAEVEEVQAPATSTPLPDDFPHRDILAEAGIETLEAVPADADGLKEIEGIGGGRARKILAALGAL